MIPAALPSGNDLLPTTTVDSSTLIGQAMDGHNAGGTDPMSLESDFEMQCIKPIKSTDPYKKEECTIKIITERHLFTHHSYEVFDFGLIEPLVSCSEPSVLVDDLKVAIQNKFQIPKSSQKLWLFVTRTNGTFRPFDPLEKESYEHLFYEREYSIFVEEIKNPIERMERDGLKLISIFVKYYDPDTQRLYFCGHASLDSDKTFVEHTELFQTMCKNNLNIVCDQFDIFEEVYPSRVDMCNPSHRLGHEAELIDGDIIILQKKTTSHLPEDVPLVPELIWNLIKKDKYLITTSENENTSDLPKSTFDVFWYFRLLGRFDKYFQNLATKDSNIQQIKEALRVRQEWLNVSVEFPIFIK